MTRCSDSQIPADPAARAAGRPPAGSLAFGDGDGLSGWRSRNLWSEELMIERGTDWPMTERFIPEAELASNESSTNDPEQHAGPRRDIVQQGDAQHEAALGGLHEAPESEAETKEEASVSDRKREIVSDLLIRLVDAAESRIHYGRCLADLKLAAACSASLHERRDTTRYDSAGAMHAINSEMKMEAMEMELIREHLEGRMAKCLQEVEEIQKTILVYVA